MKAGLRWFVLGLTALAAGMGHAQQQPAPAGTDKPTLISGRMYTTQGYAMYRDSRPFTLEATVSRASTLPKGTTRTDEAMERAYRDSAGRFRLEEGRMAAREFQVRRITLFDPVALTCYTFSPGGTTANLVRVRTRDLPTAEDELQAAAQRERSEAYRKEHPGAGEQLLGSQVLAGEVAEGKRRTVTFPGPPGKEARRITTETWMSVYLEVSMLTITENSGMGTTTRRVTALQRVEPDPALFRLPGGLKVVEGRSGFGPML